jgi:hypothetical protein
MSDHRKRNSEVDGIDRIPRPQWLLLRLYVPHFLRQYAHTEYTWNPDVETTQAVLKTSERNLAASGSLSLGRWTLARRLFCTRYVTLPKTQRSMMERVTRCVPTSLIRLDQTRWLTPTVTKPRDQINLTQVEGSRGVSIACHILD